MGAPKEEVNNYIKYLLDYSIIDQDILVFNRPMKILFDNVVVSYGR